MSQDPLYVFQSLTHDLK